MSASNESAPGGSAVSATSQATGVVQAVAPRNVAAPALAGVTEDGSTLTVSDGEWSGAPAPTYTYQWERCQSGHCAVISGATGNSYKLNEGDVGISSAPVTMRALVFASNSSYSGGGSSIAIATSTSVSAKAPNNTSSPTISGTTTDGQQLTVNAGVWSGTAVSSYTYQWQRCNAEGSSCAGISGATGKRMCLVTPT